MYVYLYFDGLPWNDIIMTVVSLTRHLLFYNHAPCFYCENKILDMKKKTFRNAKWFFKSILFYLLTNYLFSDCTVVNSPSTTYYETAMLLRKKIRRYLSQNLPKCKSHWETIYKKIFNNLKKKVQPYSPVLLLFVT